MGYYTNHNLTIENATFEQQRDIFEFLKENEDDYYGLEIDHPGNYFEGIEEVKWYWHETDMANLAVKFPYATFILHGEGEEPDDIWEEKYHGCEKQRREIQMVWGEWR